jgi:signal peptidase
MLSVESNSMERNNGGYHPDAWDEYYIQDIQKGDLVYDDVFNGDLNSLKIGDVITFYDAVIDNLNTHRIVYINVENGYVVTQGDYVITQYPNDSHYYDATMTDVAKNDMLTSDHSSAQIVQKTEIRGVVTGVNRGAGSVLSNIRQNWLFYFVLPIAAILLIEIVFVVKNFLDLRHEKNKASLQDDKEAMMAELEAEKEKMRQELLAELRAQQQAEAKPEEVKTEEAKEEPTEETPTEEPAVEEENEVEDNTEVKEEE